MGRDRGHGEKVEVMGRSGGHREGRGQVVEITGRGRGHREEVEVMGRR